MYVGKRCVHFRSGQLKSCFALQHTYFIPSVHQSTPCGKLYFKVINLITKRRKMGLKMSNVNKSVSSFNDLSNLENVNDGV